jgi:hypothetical protein
MSDRQLYDAARWSWSMSAERAGRERYAVVSGGGVVRQVIGIDRVVDAPGGRLAFEGRILGPGDPVHDHYVGRPAPNGRQQNPITYFDSRLDGRECNCGCGKPISRGEFLPGHDQRAIHERIARVGTVMDFITWFDRTWEAEATVRRPVATRRHPPTATSS